jgi:hypothetical protein
MFMLHLAKEPGHVPSVYKAVIRQVGLFTSAVSWLSLLF